MFASLNPFVAHEAGRSRTGAVQQLSVAGRQLNVALLGMGQRMEQMLHMFFQTQCQDRYTAADEEENADLSIIDLDGRGGEALWREHASRFPGRPCILLSLTEVDAGDGELVSKPLRIKRLQAALDRIRDRLLPQPQVERPESVGVVQHPSHQTAEILSPLRLRPEAAEAQGRNTAHSGPAKGVATPATAAQCMQDKEIYAFIGSAPDMDLTDPQQVQKVQYDPKQFLIGHILAATRLGRKEQRPVRLATPYGSLTLLPEIKGVLVEMKHRHLRLLAAVPIREEDISLSVLKPDQVADTDQGLWQDLDTFVWNLTLICSRGRMPVGTDPTAPVALHNWPNLTRLRLFPHALQIAALWINRPVSLQETASELGIPQRFVFAFYSAAQNLGLIKIDSTVRAKPLPVKKQVEHGLLGRILKHLQFRQDPELQHT
jgi:hypothetical protein